MPTRENGKQNFSKRVKELRVVLGLTQRQLAAEFRVSPGAVALWESGSRKVSGPITKLVELYEQTSKAEMRNKKLGEK